VQGNFFDGNANTQSSGIVGDTGSQFCIITNNMFWSQSGAPIYLSDPFQMVIGFNGFLNNNLLDNPSQSVGADIIIAGVTFGPTSNNIIGNTFYRSDPKAHPVLAIYELNNGFDPFGNTYESNKFYQTALQYQSPAIGLAATSNSWLHGNNGIGTDTDVSGAFTPTVIGSTGGTATLTAATGQYQRTGKLVTVSVDITIDSVSGCSGNLHIGNLPYIVNPASPGSYLTIGRMSGITMPGVTPTFAAISTIMAVNSAQVFIMGSNFALTELPLSGVSNGASLSFSGSYFVQ
jgi:hypothetical protein